MAYPIPKEIKYEEKLAFNLTAKQLIYLIVGIFIAYTLFETFFPILGSPFGFVPSFIVIMFTIGFAFLDLEEIAFSLFSYYTQIRSGGFDSPEVKRFMEVKRISDDFIFLRNGEARAVLRVHPINFSTFDAKRKRRVTNLFASFLQQLEHPIQLHVRTVNIDLYDYFERLEKKVREKNPDLLPLFLDFKKFEHRLIKSNDVKNRVFYVIIPFKSTKNFRESIESFNKKIEVIQESLNEIGLKNSRLSNDELIAFLASYFEERLLIRNEYLGGRTLLKRWAEYKKKEERDSATELEKIEKFEKEILMDVLCPSRIETKVDHIKINETYYRPIIGVGFPKYVEDAWLERLIGSRDNYDISIHIEPSSIEQAKVILHNQIVKEEADLAMAAMRGIHDPSLENKLEDTLELFDWLDRGEERLFSVSIYIMVKAKTLKELDFLTEKCKADLNSVSIIPKIPYYQMVDAVKSTMPLGIDKIKKVREFPTSTLAASFPFMTPTIDLEEGTDGILIAHDKATLNPIIIDFSKLSNAHMMILAKSGAGKSYTAKLLLTRMMLSGVRVYVIDPNGEYLRLCKHYGGEVVTLSRTSKTIINPLDLFGQSYADKRISLMGIFSLMCGGLSPLSEGILDIALQTAYQEKGITEDKSTWNRTPPKISDVVDVLKEMSLLYEKKKDTVMKKEADILITKLTRYTKKGVYGFVDQHTNLDVGRGFVVFDINDLPEEVKPLYMFIVLEYITNITKKNLDRKVIVIDEGWSLLNNEKTAERILWLIKASRKFNTGLLFITQEVNDLIGTKAGESILANTSTKIFLGQDSSVIEDVSEILHLNQKEKNILTVARPGEGLLFIENSIRVPIVIKASPKEHDLVTTHPEDLAKIRNEQSEDDNLNSKQEKEEKTSKKDKK